MLTLEAYRETAVSRIAQAETEVRTEGRGLVPLDTIARDFLGRARATDGLLLLFCRHTSASLVIQENASPEVPVDLLLALDRLAPEGVGWRHDEEGPDDMPAHVKAMLTGASLLVPVADGRMRLGTWQGLFLVEHRRRPHRRRIGLAYVGA